MSYQSRVKNTIIGNALEFQRKAMNLTRSQLASKLGVQAQYVANWERGQCLPPKKKLNILANTLGMSKKDIVKLYTRATKVALEEYLDSINENDSELLDD